MTTQDAVRAGLSVALLGLIALHLLEPQLSITWSYAHLSRDAWRVAAALGLSIALPVLGQRAWRQPRLAHSLEPIPAARAALVAVGVVAGLALLGGLFPAPASNYDFWVLIETLRGTREAPIRWMLGVWALEGLSAPFRDSASFTACVGAINGAFAGLGALGVVAAARELARTRGEALAFVALVLSAFGTLQISIGYIEIYPTAFCVLGVYTGFAARAICRGAAGDFVGCAVVGALAPFVYVGLALVLPSLLVVAWVAARHPQGRQRLAWAAFAGLATAGLATLPHYGTPFAWFAFLADLRADGIAELGLQTGSALLPASYAWSLEHLNEVAHSLLLVDSVGALLLLGPGLAVAHRWLRARERSLHPFAVFLLAIAGPFAIYAAAMDPIYGAYQDWDLWVTGLPALSMLGAWAFIVWARDERRWAGAVLGLALACAGVHALARLHAIPVDSKRHLRESPRHVAPRAPSAAASTAEFRSALPDNGITSRQPSAAPSRSAA